MSNVSRAWNIDDLRRMASRNVPKHFFDYLYGGANSETTMQSNRADFARWDLKQKVLVGIQDNTTDLGTGYLGEQHKLPMLLAPIGFAGMHHHHGEIAAGRAAEKAGIAQVLSTFSIASLEEVAQSHRGSLYFQLYMFRKRELTEHMLERCRRAKIGTIFLTVDTPFAPVRERDERNGFRARTSVSPGMLVSMLRHPLWCLGTLANGMPNVGNCRPYPELGKSLMEQAVNLGRMIDASLSWNDIGWLRDRWEGKIVIKGILDADDARRAVDQGIDGIVVSNHGGRQLDPAPSTIDILPEIVQAVGGRTEILMDGGIRRGADVLKALALGATAVLIGRAYIYGLGAGGEKGVARCLELLAGEMRPALNMMGFHTIAELKAAGADALRQNPWFGRSGEAGDQETVRPNRRGGPLTAVN
ncbi:alpha-hydroxy acid oxidase [Paraburkholderia caballeronis]|uniref:FMN-dependent dehydrogenase, includes L-lactate dehydrogenase and type II isopentenyl diphosphate isomerase n=1 Tax=Paraburkholderia caballeronis TaxID=416943 RepID=A0A1H7F9Q1_9BURK|nr:alpha-hydroxy acid oxidase [Paraburkholderia caballeronis]PXW24040.1 isopentenyl diphosphate isomerase/L-lactate dehydrogenase-like FMN-dependent dehydrogenase [Paraburkholderia caballeronis]PXW99804.1 isopentenyl diphosphate isomerase/L-lactate dehydrogenase-like FMN-dependent dehydrogenase [Paraburkholderia caballeronis]RAJ96758.1 isopentenyl diphosphate isomerase/L-lactate dehydrogenase-like FMN-dependent dehydrogenase [Paraburkholderia caballeronis]SEE75176.1 FMN-dependent dehydrogenase,